MAQRQLSRTLPKNFTFPSMDVEEPKTPRRPSSIKVPSRPQNPFHGRRRLRGETLSAASRDVSACIDLDLFQFRGLPDVPLPSIEVGHSNVSNEPSSEEQPSNDERYLAPPRQRMMFKTPPAQTQNDDATDGDALPWPSWDSTPGPDIERPGSACSNLSDSSIESIETFASRPSVGGSCSSVESDSFGTYFPIEFTKEKELEMSSPTLPKKKNVQRSQLRSTWTRDMDNHLWNTYQLYLQDPTMTPFKMTPGSIPPLGVTTRVARRAKKTWEKKHRLAKSHPMHNSDRSGSSTPTATAGASKVQWPKSDAKTRHRLKKLCRRKFSIMPHYHRMMQSCSPEPAADEFENEAASAYATRDLGVSLVTSHDQTPLTQLAREPAPETKTEWFNNPVQSDIETPRVQAFNQHLNVDPHIIPRLGSPFVYSTWGPGGSAHQVEGVPRSARRETVHVPNRVRRNTHFDMTPRDQDDVFSPKAFSPRPYVENDPCDEEVHQRLNDYLRDSKGSNIIDGRARIPRTRGMTTGAVSRSRDVSQLFSPPSSLNSSQIEPEETTPVSKPVVNPLLSLGGENIKRLGSPFKVEGAFKRRTAPGRFIRHAPSLSDPFSNAGFPAYPGSMGPSPIQEQEKPQAAPVPEFQNPFEEGLSDAERIRRQILHMHSMRN